MEIELIKSGLISFIEENYKTAIDQFTKALERTPDNIEALIYRGSTFDKIGNYKLGLEDLDKAFAENKNELLNYDILYTRAKLYLNSNNFKAALEDLNKAKEIHGLKEEQTSNIDKLIKLVS